jgi:hypothetical protein
MAAIGRQLRDVAQTVADAASQSNSVVGHLDVNAAPARAQRHAQRATGI